MIEHVSDTALWVATYRAMESERSDALFHDPFAALLTGEKGRRIARWAKASRYTKWSVVIRTCIIDSYVQKLIAEGVDTVLNLGAGLDARPYRMSLPESLSWIEIDFPSIIDYKEQKLANEKPKCQLTRIRLDLADEKARRASFSDINENAGKSVLVLTEGVIPYLTEDHVSALARDLHSQDRFHYWVAEYYSPRVWRYLRSKRMRRQMRNAPFQFFPADWFGFFAKAGWNERETRYLPVESQRLGRPIPAPWWTVLLTRFMPAEKRESLRKLSGYLLLERQ
jgi:methyltransferase (TIGR00027 family)